MIFCLASLIERFPSFALALSLSAQDPTKEVLATRFIMKSLFGDARFQIESLRGSAVSSAPTMEAIMLDVVFVALGIAVLALMGAYALSLRRL